MKNASTLITYSTYTLIMLVAAILPLEGGIAKYNGIILLLFSSIFFLFYRDKSKYKCTIILCSLIIVFSLKQPKIYIILDCCLVFFIFTCIEISTKPYLLSFKHLNTIKYLFIATNLLSLICLFFPRFYIETNEGYRYGGLFHSVNFSSNVFVLFQIAIWEIYKITGNNLKNKRTLLILLIVLLFYMVASGTRSLLFFLPYWFAEFFYTIKKTQHVRQVLIAFSLIILFSIPYIKNVLEEKMRIQEGESSIETRLSLYTELWNGIVNNYVIVPNGAYSAQQLIERFTNNEDFSPHNDFLRYTYEYGCIFFLMLYLMYRHMKRKGIINFQFCLIILGCTSFALHNMLFSVYLWLPFTIIMYAKFYGRKNFTSDCKKIQ